MGIVDSLAPNFKDTLTSRGIRYHYYFSAPATGKATILFVHGFPSLAVDWHHQIAYFKEKGYGLVVPDQLGYGGTDKPTEKAAYVQSLVAKDLVDILDHEKVTDAVAVGHDWGSKTTSVLANLHSDRFIGFGYLAVGYVAPALNGGLDYLREMSIKHLGRETFGYWDFFTAPDAPGVIKAHVNSFVDLLYARDARLLLSNVCPTGAIRIFVESDTRTPRATFISEELLQLYEEEYSKHGLDHPLNYYRQAIGEEGAEDDKGIPPEKYSVQKPVFFGGALRDAVCVAAAHEAQTRQFCPNLTVASFDATHWVAAEVPKEVNEALEKWIQGIAKT